MKLSRKLLSALIVFTLILFMIINDLNLYSDINYYQLESWNYINDSEIVLYNKYTNVSHRDELTKFKYRLQNGRPFDERWNIYLHELNLFEVNNVDDEHVMKSEPIICTAVSSGRTFSEIFTLLDTISTVFQRNKNSGVVYLYDLGLNLTERKMLMDKYRNIIGEIRIFSFDKYPSYFKKLRSFRWKPIIIAELLKEFPSLWWMDSSAQILQSPLQYYSEIKSCFVNTSACKLYPWLMLKAAGHSIYATTDQRLYDFFPISRKTSKKLEMFDAGLQLIYATKDVRESVLRYWVLCALDPDCMDPSGSSIECDFSRLSRYRIYAGCHRQDQSAINVLLSLANNFDVTKYRRDFDGIKACEIH